MGEYYCLARVTSWSHFCSLPAVRARTLAGTPLAPGVARRPRELVVANWHKYRRAKAVC